MIWAKSRYSIAIKNKHLLAQTVKHLPAMRETRVRFLGREDPLEKGTQSTPALLPGKSHGQRNLIGYSLWGSKESDTTERLHFHKIEIQGWQRIQLHGKEFAKKFSAPISHYVTA